GRSGILLMSPAPAQARVERLDIAGERSAPAAAAPRGWQERLRLPLMLIAPLVVLAGALYFYFTGGRYQSTDDAYVEAAQVVISANISGRVSEIDVRDNE